MLDLFSIRKWTREIDKVAIFSIFPIFKITQLSQEKRRMNIIRLSKITETSPTGTNEMKVMIDNYLFKFKTMNKTIHYLSIYL
jgi:hypothetical protein